jgi:hypothetical protein
MTYHSRACRARGATAALRPRHRGSSVVRQPRPPRVHLGLLVLPRRLWLLPRRQRLCLSRALARHPRRRRGCQRRSPLGTEDARRRCLPRRPVAPWLAEPRDGTTPWPWRTMSQWPKPHRADHCVIHVLYIVCCRTRRAHPVALLQGRMCVHAMHLHGLPRGVLVNGNGETPEHPCSQLATGCRKQLESGKSQHRL